MIECTNNGVLFIDFTKILGYLCRISITPWQQGIHWTNTLESSNTPTCRFYQLGIPYRVLMLELKAEPWLKQIPEEIRPLLIEYESSYPGLLFPLLYHISRSRHAYELFINQPRITFVILMYAIHADVELNVVTAIFSLNLRSILGTCKLPPYNSAVQFIRKLRLRCFGPEEYVTMRRLLCSGNYRKYRYCEKIDDDWLYPLINNPDLVKIPIVRKMRINYHDFNFVDTHNIITSLLRNMDVGDNCLTKCRTIDSLIELCVRLTDQAENQRRSQLPDIDYGDPPMRGSEHIIPITTLKKLALEGQNQGNCVESYHGRILSGKSFAYKVLKPERATLMLSKDNEGCFKIDQLKSAKNGEPSGDTKAAVVNWYNQSILGYLNKNQCARLP